VNRSDALLAELPPALATPTSTVPAACAGEVAVIEVSESMVYVVAALEPKLTAVAPLKPLPVTVMVVPPATGPACGLIPVTVGAVV
jgi:hypothetical protein